MTPEPHSEADTRQQLIDKQLGFAGWNVADPSQVIQELDIYVADGKPGAVRERPATPYAGHQFADYGLLLGPTPAAVVEAKPPMELQRRFDSVISKIDRLKRSLQNHSASTVALFDSLAQRAFGGSRGK